MRSSTFRVGVIGHRYLADEQRVFVELWTRAILTHVQGLRRRPVALTAMAEGTDTIFAEQALRLGIPLGVLHPFRDYLADFSDGKTRERFLGLSAAAAFVVAFGNPVRSDHAYLASMNWIVDRSHLVVIAWNGRRNDGLRATERSVLRCVRAGKPWFHLDTQRLQTAYYVGRRPLSLLARAGCVVRGG